MEVPALDHDPEILETAFCVDADIKSNHGFSVEELHSLFDWAVRNKAATKAVMAAAELELTNRAPILFRQMFSLWAQNVGANDPTTVVCLINWYVGWKQAKEKERLLMEREKGSSDQTLSSISPKARDLLLASVVFLTNYCRKSRYQFHLSRTAVNATISSDDIELPWEESYPAAGQSVTDGLGDFRVSWGSSKENASSSVQEIQSLDLDRLYRLWLIYLLESQASWMDISENCNLNPIYLARIQKGDPQMELGGGEPPAGQKDDPLYQALAIEQMCLTMLQLLLSCRRCEHRTLQEGEENTSWPELDQALELVLSPDKPGTEDQSTRTAANTNANTQDRTFHLEEALINLQNRTKLLSHPRYFELRLFTPLLRMSLDSTSRLTPSQQKTLLTVLCCLMEAIACELETPDHLLLTSATVMVCRQTTMQWNRPMAPTHPPQRLLESTEIKKACHLLIPNLRSSHARLSLGFIEDFHLCHRNHRVRRLNFPYPWDTQRVESAHEHTRLRFFGSGAQKAEEGDPYFQAAQQIFREQEKIHHRWLSFEESLQKLHQRAVELMGSTTVSLIQPSATASTGTSNFNATIAMEVAEEDTCVVSLKMQNSDENLTGQETPQQAGNAEPSCDHLENSEESDHKFSTSAPSLIPIISPSESCPASSNNCAPVPSQSLLSSRTSSSYTLSFMENPINTPTCAEITLHCGDPQAILRPGQTLRLVINLVPGGCSSSPVTGTLTTEEITPSSSSSSTKTTPAPAVAKPATSKKSNGSSSSSSSSPASRTSPPSSNNPTPKGKEVTSSRQKEVSSSAQASLEKYWKPLITDVMSAAECTSLATCPLGQAPAINKKMIALHSGRQKTYKGPFTVDDLPIVQRWVVCSHIMARIWRDPTTTVPEILTDGPLSEKMKVYVVLPSAATAPADQWSLREHQLKNDKRKCQVLVNRASAGFTLLHQQFGDKSSSTEKPATLADLIVAATLNLLYRVLLLVGDGGFQNYLLDSNEKNLMAVDLDEPRSLEHDLLPLLDTDTKSDSATLSLRDKVLQLLFSTDKLPTKKSQPQILSVIQSRATYLQEKLQEAVSEPNLEAIYAFAQSKHISIIPKAQMITLARKIRSLLREFAASPPIHSSLVSHRHSPAAPANNINNNINNNVTPTKRKSAPAPSRSKVIQDSEEEEEAVVEEPIPKKKRPSPKTPNVTPPPTKKSVTRPTPRVTPTPEQEEPTSPTDHPGEEEEEEGTCILDEESVEMMEAEDEEENQPIQEEKPSPPVVKKPSVSSSSKKPTTPSTRPTMASKSPRNFSMINDETSVSNRRVEFEDDDDDLIGD